MSKPPIDRRAKAALLRRGYAVDERRARQVLPADFDRFDLLIAVDHEVLADLRRASSVERAPMLRLLLDYAPGHEGQDLADPYYGDPAGFERALDLCEIAIDGLLASRKGEHGAARARGARHP